MLDDVRGWGVAPPIAEPFPCVHALHHTGRIAESAVRTWLDGAVRLGLLLLHCFRQARSGTSWNEGLFSTYRHILEAPLPRILHQHHRLTSKSIGVRFRYSELSRMMHFVDDICSNSDLQQHSTLYTLIAPTLQQTRIRAFLRSKFQLCWVFFHGECCTGEDIWDVEDISIMIIAKYDISCTVEDQDGGNRRHLARNEN